MYKNYFILTRYTQELNHLLKKSKVINIYTYQKDTLHILLKKSDNQFVTLEISVNHGFPYIRYIDKEIKVKKYVKIFDELVGMEINNVEIASNDRVVKFNLSAAHIYYAIRGKFTNIYVLIYDKFTSFKKIEEEVLDEIYQEFKQILFINDYIDKELENLLQQNKDIDIIKANYPIISKDIWQVFENNNMRTSLELLDLLNKISNDDIILVKSKNQIHFKVQSLYQISEYDTIIYRDNYVYRAIDKFIIESYQLERYFKLFKLVENYLSKELNKISNTLNNLKNLLDNKKDENHYENIANNLMINIDKLHKRMDVIELVDVITNEKIKIKLNPKLTPYENINYYYQKQKDQKKAYEINFNKYNNLKDRYNYLLLIKNKVGKNLSYQELKNIADELGIKDKDVTTPDKQNITDKFRYFRLDDKYDFYVGKDNESNDLLTVKFAKPNDLWFHVKDVASAHGVLRKVNLKENIPNKILEKAAQIIAYNSKLKGSSLVPVICTSKKYVVKNKNMMPGEVRVLKEEQVLLVKPALPE